MNRDAQPGAPAELDESQPPPRRGSETILLVEDELSILKITAIMLEKMGYTVVAAASPDEAIPLANEHGARIDLLVTDVVMPDRIGDHKP